MYVKRVLAFMEHFLCGADSDAIKTVTFKTETWQNLRDRDFIKNPQTETRDLKFETETRDFRICAICRNFLNTPSSLPSGIFF